VGEFMKKRMNIELDEALLAEAMQLTGAKTKHEVVDMALHELVRIKKRKDLTDLAGKIRFHKGYDHKKIRWTRYDAD
jgi:Arc/MetJ family transcription regulator